MNIFTYNKYAVKSPRVILPIELKDVKGNINIENISFTYEDKKEVLKGLNLNIEAGKTVALVGPSGGGKTTLCSLIPRFYEFEQGDIKIDGISVKDVSLKSLRKNIGVVQHFYGGYAAVLSGHPAAFRPFYRPSPVPVLHFPALFGEPADKKHVFFRHKYNYICSLFTMTGNQIHGQI